jgi:hypothetical protein
MAFMNQYIAHRRPTLTARCASETSKADRQYRKSNELECYSEPTPDVRLYTLQSDRPYLRTRYR